MTLEADCMGDESRAPRTSKLRLFTQKAKNELGTRLKITLTVTLLGLANNANVVSCCTRIITIVHTQKVFTQKWILRISGCDWTWEAPTFWLQRPPWAETPTRFWPVSSEKTVNWFLIRSVHTHNPHWIDKILNNLISGRNGSLPDRQRPAILWSGPELPATWQTGAGWALRRGNPWGGGIL